mmetsp:Transcript_79601/g.157682  ORF Transcript_79601/g.157682 Transcript_79601/m.157682 type:complete len:98 (-) Transcript_79601:14-307(-)
MSKDNIEARDSVPPGPAIGIMAAPVEFPFGFGGEGAGAGAGAGAPQLQDAEASCGLGASKVGSSCDKAAPSNAASAQPWNESDEARAILFCADLAMS